MKKLIKSAIMIAFVLSCCNNTILATETDQENNISPDSKTVVHVSWSVAVDTLKRANTTFSVEAGETVVISCPYSPASADVDFGLIDSDNRFHYIAGNRGKIGCTITIEERGEYRFAVYNHSPNVLSVLGFVEY